MTETEDFFDSKDITRSMTCRSRFGDFFGVSQEIFDCVWKKLCNHEDTSTLYVSMEIGADPDVFNPVRDLLVDKGIKHNDNPRIAADIDKHLNGPGKIPNYGGGLGVLAGDTLKSLADCRIPVSAISLLYRKGYFSQVVDSELGQINWSQPWEPEKTPGLYLLHAPNKPDEILTIEVPFYDEHDQEISTFARVWMKLEINSRLDFFVPQFLLDFDIEPSPQWIREGAQNLYDSSSQKMKIIQRRMLGGGIIPTCRALGLTPTTVHLNEQHGVAVALLQIVDILKENLGDNYARKATDADIIAAANRVAKRIVYTIHTPVKAGHDIFESQDYRAVGHSFCQRILKTMGTQESGSDAFNMTRLAMKVNRSTNSVSRLHRDVTRKQFPAYADKITAITNGVHHLTWISKNRGELFDSFQEFNGWRRDPGVFAGAIKLADNKKFHTYLEEAWGKDNLRLIDSVNKMLRTHRNQMENTWIIPPNYLSLLDGDNSLLVPNALTIGFARRFSTYKRADLIFEDLDLLLAPIIRYSRPVNFIFAGKAHPQDEAGKKLIKAVLDCQEELYIKSRGLARLVFIPGYDMSVAKLMVAGAHVWLNSPKRPLEASGTSGMKAALNGVPNLSIIDGWWAEGYHDGQTGWKFGYEGPVDAEKLSEERKALLYKQDSQSFYQVFPEVMAIFHDPEKRSAFLRMAVMNLALNGPKFNTSRVVAEYVPRYCLNLPQSTANKLEKLRQIYRSDPDFNLESYPNK